MATRCTCGSGHATFGACVRAKNLHTDFNAAANRAHERELDTYLSARKQGVQPGGTTMAATRYALDTSDMLGRAFDASDPLKGVEVE